MRRVIGLCMFWLGIGMTLMLFLRVTLWVLIIIIALIIAGYNLFCN